MGVEIKERVGKKADIGGAIASSLAPLLRADNRLIAHLR
jgi:hypothetical protein